MGLKPEQGVSPLPPTLATASKLSMKQDPAAKLLHTHGRTDGLTYGTAYHYIPRPRLLAGGGDNYCHKVNRIKF